MQDISIVYKHKDALEYLRTCVEQVSHLISNTEKLEVRIFKQLASYLSTDKQSYARIKHIVNREIALALKQYRVERASLFCTLSKKDDFGESLEFEPYDILANVEDTVVEKSSIDEKIAGLASDDRERITLYAWANGTSDVEISKTLAGHFGGKFESHRTFVKRFKAKCQRKLAA